MTTLWASGNTSEIDTIKLSRNIDGSVQQISLTDITNGTHIASADAVVINSVTALSTLLGGHILFIA